MHRMKATLLLDEDVAFIFGEAGEIVGFSLQLDAKTGNTFRHGMAWILCVGFFAVVPLGFASQQWFYTQKGTWLIVPGDSGGIAALIWLLMTSAGAVLFLAGGIFTRFVWERVAYNQELSVMDIVYFTAWIETLSVFFSFLFPFWPDSIRHLVPYFPFLWMIVLTCLMFWKRWDKIGMVNTPSPSWLVWILAVIGVYVPVFLFLDQIITNPVAKWFSLELSSWRENLISENLHHADASGILISGLQWLLIGLIGPVAEEIFFRGLIQSWISKICGNGLAIFLSAISFSLFHMDVTKLAPLFALGLILAFFRFWTGQLWAPIFFHVLNNLIAILFEYLPHS